MLGDVLQRLLRHAIQAQRNFRAEDRRRSPSALNETATRLSDENWLQ